MVDLPLTIFAFFVGLFSFVLGLGFLLLTVQSFDQPYWPLSGGVGLTMFVCGIAILITSGKDLKDV